MCHTTVSEQPALELTIIEGGQQDLVTELVYSFLHLSMSFMLTISLVLVFR